MNFFLILIMFMQYNNFWAPQLRFMYHIQTFLVYLIWLSFVLENFLQSWILKCRLVISENHDCVSCTIYKRFLCVWFDPALFLKIFCNLEFWNVDCWFLRTVIAFYVSYANVYCICIDLVLISKFIYIMFSLLYENKYLAPI